MSLDELVLTEFHSATNSVRLYTLRVCMSGSRQRRAATAAKQLRVQTIQLSTTSTRATKVVFDTPFQLSPRILPTLNSFSAKHGTVSISTDFVHIE